jgi:hypothetical protein
MQKGNSQSVDHSEDHHQEFKTLEPRQLPKFQNVNLDAFNASITSSGLKRHDKNRLSQLKNYSKALLTGEEHKK